MCPCSCSYLCICDFEKQEEQERKRKKDREDWSGWRIVSTPLRCAVAWCVALQRDNRMPALLTYLCCIQRSCFCCLLLPAKSHPATTWGRRSAPPGLCSSSSARGQITNINYLLILVIKGTLISSELGSSAALNGQKHTSEIVACVCVSVCVLWPADNGCIVAGVVTNGGSSLFYQKKNE